MKLNTSSVNLSRASSKRDLNRLDDKVPPVGVGIHTRTGNEIVVNLLRQPFGEAGFIQRCLERSLLKAESASEQIEDGQDHLFVRDDLLATADAQKKPLFPETGS